MRRSFKVPIVLGVEPIGTSWFSRAGSDFGRVPPHLESLNDRTDDGFGPDVESWESSRIVRRADGTVSLVAQRKGGAALDYPLIVAGADSMEFANAAHDPQRIRFARQGQLLMIEISKIDGSDAVLRNYRPVETAPKD